MPEAYRITAIFQDGDFEIKKVQRITKRIPPGTDAMPKDQTGTWLVVTGKKGAQLYARNVFDAGDRGVEVQTGDPDAPFAWVPDKRPTRLFHMLVPVMPGMKTVQLVEQLPGKGKKLTTTRHLDISVADIEDAIRKASRDDKEGGR